jgi:methyl-accepting chemotaxis protein
MAGIVVIVAIAGLLWTRRTLIRRLRFSDWRLSSKVTVVAVVAVGLMGVLVAFYVLPRMEERMRLDKMTGVREVVEVAASQVEACRQRVDRGELTEAEGQREALDRLRVVRYNKTDYLWVNTQKGEFLMHPIKPELVGKPMMDARDPAGFPYMAEFCRVAREQGAGVVRYTWSKPGSDKPVSKVSYVQEIGQWGWVIGTGVYEDDVQAEIADVSAKVLGGVVVASVLAVLLGIVMGRFIGKRVERIAEAAGRLATGAVDVELEATADRDEVGRLITAFRTMIESIKGQALAADRIAAGDLTVQVEVRSEKDALGNALRNAVQSLRGLVEEFQVLSRSAVEGKLSRRGHAEKFQGGYQEIVVGVNNTLDAVIGPLNVAAEYMDRIAKGDIPPKITEEYHGDFNEIKKNLNTCIAAVNALIADGTKLSSAAVAGQLSVRADATQHQGDFRKIVEGMNSTTAMFAGVLQGTIDHLQHLSMGVVDAQITEEYTGEYIRLKDGFNRLFVAVNGLVSDAQELTRAAEEGRLRYRADATQHQGDFRKTVEGMNGTTEMFAGILNRTIEHIEHLGKGTVDELITREYRGDYIRLKEGFNGSFGAVR